MSRIGFTVLCSAALFASSACSDDDHDDDYERGPLPEQRLGNLEVSWSINGRTDAVVCDEVGAVAFHMNVYDDGYFIGSLDVPCADFSATQEIYEDDFVARSTLIDADGFAVVRRVFEDFFEIEEGQVTRLSMDFPDMAAVPMEPGSDAGAPPVDAGDEPDGELSDAAAPVETDAASDAGS